MDLRHASTEAEAKSNAAELLFLLLHFLRIANVIYHGLSEKREKRRFQRYLNIINVFTTARSHT
jgi:hypothetical protein